MKEKTAMNNTYLEGLQRFKKIAECRQKVGGLKVSKEVAAKYKKTGIYSNLQHYEDSIYVGYEVAKQIFFNEVLKYKIPVFCIPSMEILAHGTTLNNIKEFNFLANLLTKNEICLPMRNLSHAKVLYFLSERDPVGTAQTQSLIAMLFDIWLPRHQPLTFLYWDWIIQYSKSYMAWISSFENSSISTIPCVVIANDHTPLNVAFSMVAKNFDIPRVYLQHAEVSNLFPPLDFEISILRNERSWEIYNSIRKTSKPVFILPRGVQQKHYLNINTPFSEKPTVVVYLTSQTRLLKKNYDRMFNILLQNRYIQSIFVKPHPGDKSLKFLRSVIEKGVKVIDDIPTERHVAVVQNSSVVNELLQRGNTVYQIFCCDSIRRDYYGFVADGIVQELTLDELKIPFWEEKILKIDQKWIHAFAKRNPLADSNYDCYQQEKLLIKTFQEATNVVKIYDAINGDCPKKSTYEFTEYYYSFISKLNLYERFFVYSLYLTPRTILSKINAQSEKPIKFALYQKLSDEDYIKLVKKMHDERIPEIYDVLKISRDFKVNSSLICWLQLFSVGWTKIFICEEDIRNIFDFIMKCENTKIIKSSLERLFLEVLIAQKKIEYIDYFFNHSQTININNLSISTRLRLLDLLLSLRGSEKNETQKVYSLLEYEKIMGKLSEFDKLKFLFLIQYKYCKIDKHWCHKLVCQEFYKTANVSLKKEFNRYVLPIYQRFDSRMLYMDIRYREEQRNELLNLIQTKIRYKEKFSFIRLSDGEGYVFSSRSGYFGIQEMKNRERHWWGVELSEDLRNAIVSQNIHAIEQANLLGIPSVYRFLRDCDGLRTERLGTSVTGRGLLEVLNSVSTLNLLPNVMLTEEKSNVALFESHHVVHYLSKYASQTVIIASARPDYLKILFNDLGNQLVVIPIPTHLRVRHNNKYFKDSPILPNIYQNVLKTIDDIVKPGTLVLVAAGVIGKIFIGRAKQHGGVALDVGEGLDRWLDRCIEVT